MELVVRPMETGDRSLWASLRIQLWGDLPIQGHFDDIDRMLRDWPRRQGFLALSSEMPVGFAERSIRDYANGCTAEPVPFLEGIWVDRRFRRKGVGGALIQAVVDDLLGSGFKELCSDAGIRNWRSHRAHRDWGFAETERVVYFRRAL